MQKSVKIRLNAWVSRLDGIIANPVWKRNRNSYAKLINLMCQCEVIIEPFSALPPEGDIPNLTKCEVNAVIDRVEMAVKMISLKTGTWVRRQIKEEGGEEVGETPK
jgi:hypothetical protein